MNEEFEEALEVAANKFVQGVNQAYPNKNISIDDMGIDFWVAMRDALTHVINQ